MTATKRRVLVVGGGGFIGQHVLTALLQAGFAVAALDLHQPSGFDSVDWMIGSANDESMVASAAAPCDTVVFLASSSLPGSGNADLAAEIGSHLRLAVKAAELCCEQGVRTFVFASSGGAVYGASDEAVDETSPTHPMSAYGVSKLAIENYLDVLSRLRGMRCVSLRVSNPFGPGQKAQRNQGFIGAAMAAAARGTVLPCWGDGSVIRDFVYVGDVATAFARCCNYEGPSRVINIGSGRGHTLRETIAEVERATGRPIEVEYQRDRAFDVPKNVLDIGLAAKLLDWRPAHSFGDGLRATARWWAEPRGA